MEREDISGISFPVKDAKDVLYASIGIDGPLDIRDLHCLLRFL